MAVDEEPAETYVDALTGRTRKKRKRSHGPRSRAHASLFDALGKLHSALYDMHGELADSTCDDLTLWVIAVTGVCRQYSFQNCRDVRGIDPHVILEEMEMPVRSFVVTEPFDVGKLKLRLVLLAAQSRATRVRDRVRREILHLPGGSEKRSSWMRDAQK